MPMKIALVTPRNSAKEDKSFYGYRFFSEFLLSKRHFSYLLSIPVLASLTSAEHEVRVFDERTSKRSTMIGAQTSWGSP